MPQQRKARALTVHLVFHQNKTIFCIQKTKATLSDAKLFDDEGDIHWEWEWVGRGSAAYKTQQKQRKKQNIKCNKQTNKQTNKHVNLGFARDCGVASMAGAVATREVPF